MATVNKKNHTESQPYSATSYSDATSYSGATSSRITTQHFSTQRPHLQEVKDTDTKHIPALPNFLPQLSLQKPLVLPADLNVFG